jgi:hypothetical protein
LRRAAGPHIEPMENRTLFSGTIAPLGVAQNFSTDATDLGAYKLHSNKLVKGAVGITDNDVYYKVELATSINLGLTLSHLLQKDDVYLLYSDGTQVNTGWANSKPTLTISQHLNAGTYYIDIHHGFIAENTTDTATSGAASTVKVKVTPARHYHIAVTDNYFLQIRGLKADDTIAPTEVVKPTSFSSAFNSGASDSVSEPTISSALAQQSGYVGYQAFTTAEGYQLWGSGGPSPDDEVQQYIGDCYFMSVISTIARDDPGLIEQDIVPQTNGNYLVKFENNGQEVDEQVDDQFPVNAAGNTVFAGIPADKDIWVAVLEKAWCYFRPDSTDPGSYDGIQSGRPSESMLAFGSTNAQDYASSTYTTASQLLTAISTPLQAGDIVDVGTQSPENWPASDPPLASGLFTGHAYSVVSVDVANNKIELRNPWATNTSGVANDGTGGYITITGDQLVQSLQDFSYGSLTAVTPDPTPTPTPTPSPTPTPTPTTTTVTTQTINGDLGPDSYSTSNGSDYDFFTFTANTNGQADISINSTTFVPELLIAEQGSNGWTVVGTDANSTGGATADVNFTAETGVTYGIGIFVSGTTDTGAYTMTVTGDLSTPAQQTPDASTGSVTGVVFADTNADGTQDSGEVGLAGWTVFIDENGTGSYVDGDPTATTDQNGNYTFTGLAAGTYTVYVEAQAGFTQTVPQTGGTSVTVAAGTVATAAVIGEVAQNGGGISGNVYSDDNGNGAQDNGEAGLSGWYVYLDLTNAGSYVEGDPYTTTDANGNFSFAGLAPGTYTTRVYAETGYTTTEGSSGYTNTVTASQNSTGDNFGEGKPAGAISGVVYSDTNGDGTQDDGETGLAGFQVYIDVGNTGAYVSGDPTATTDSTGTYTFTGLSADDYTVRVVSQSGYSTIEGNKGWTATAVAGETVNGGSFGESQATGSITGTVYDDSNRDGKLDNNEYGISNWAVFVDLDNSGGYESTDPYVLTDSYGGYTISGLAPGTYTVEAYVYSGSRWVAAEGSDGWTVTVVGNQTTFAGNFGEI